MRELLRRISVLELAVLWLMVVGAVAVLALLFGCSPAPARNRVTPGSAGVAREVRGPIEFELEIRQPRPQRVYVPTEAEPEGGDDGER